MNNEQIQSVRDTFQSILRADYISISEVEQLKELNEYYVDFFKVLLVLVYNYGHGKLNIL